MYVTYDLPEERGPDGRPSRVVHAAKEFIVPGIVVDWEVGKFLHGSGERVHGIRLNYSRPTLVTGRHLEAQIIELPASAINVDVHGKLPEEYRDGLDAAAA